MKCTLIKRKGHQGQVNQLPEPRRYAGGVTVQNKALYVFGGATNKGITNSMYRYGIIDKEWERLDCTSTPGERIGFSMILKKKKTKHEVEDTDIEFFDGSKIIVYGGVNRKRQPMNDVILEYTIGGNDWKEIKGSGELPQALSNHSCLYCVHSDSMLIFGGNDIQRREWVNDIYRLRFDDMKWKRIEPTSKVNPQGRCGHSCQWLSSTSFVIFGGATSAHRLNDCWIFDLKTYSWYQLQTKGNSPMPRNNHGCVIQQKTQCMYIFGGFPYNNELHELNLQTLMWRRIGLQGDQIPSPRYGHVMCTIPNLSNPNAQLPSLLIFGGMNDQKEVLSDVYEFHPAEEHRYNLQIREYSDKMLELRFKFVPTVLTHEAEKLVLEQKSEQEIVESLLENLMIEKLNPQIRDPANKHKPQLIRRLSELVSEFKELDESSRYHSTHQKRLAQTMQALIAQYLRQHQKLKEQALIASRHELFRFYNRFQKKLNELFLRYQNITYGRSSGGNSPVKISTHEISNEVIKLATEYYYLLVPAAKSSQMLIAKLMNKHLKSLHLNGNMSDFVSRIATIEYLSEAISRALTLRYSEQISCLTTELAKPAVLDEKNKLQEGKLLGGCETLADCGVKRIQYYIESKSITSDEYEPIEEIVRRMLEVVFRGGVEKGFHQDIQPTNIETKDKRFKFSDIGVFTLSGIEVEGHGSFGAPEGRECCTQPHVYKFRKGTSEEVRGLGLLKVDPIIMSPPPKQLNELEKTQERIRELKVEVAKLRKEIDHLQAIKSEYEQYKAKVESDQMIEKTFRETETRKQMEYQKEVAKKEREYQKKLQKLENDCKIINGKHIDLHDRFKQLEQHHETVKAYNEELINRIEQLKLIEAEHAKQKTRIQQLESFKESVESKHKRLPKKVKSLQDSVQSLKEAISESKKEDYESIVTQEKNLKKELAAKHIELAQLRREFNAFKSRMDNELQQKNLEIDSLKANVSTKESTNLSIEENFQVKLNSYKQTLNIRISKLEGELNKKQELLNRYTIERAKHTEIEETLRQRLKELEDQFENNKYVQEMKSKVEKLNGQNEALKIKIAELDDKLLHTNRKLEEKIQRNDISSLNSEHLLQENRALQDRIAKLKSIQTDNKKLRNDVAELTSIRNQLSDMKTINDELKEQIELERQRSSDLEKNFETVSQQNQRLLNELGEMKLLKNENLQQSQEIQKMSRLIKLLQERIGKSNVDNE